MDRRAHAGEGRDRTWIWSGFVLLLVAVVVTALLWLHRMPPGAIDHRALNGIEAELRREGFVLTNDARVQFSVVFGLIPIGKILGTADDEIQLPFSRDGAVFQMEYKIRRDRAYDFSLSADPMHAERTRELAEELAKVNPRVVVRLSTNEVANSAQ